MHCLPNGASINGQMRQCGNGQIGSGKNLSGNYATVAKMKTDV
jgi:hypothetical protein